MQGLLVNDLPKYFVLVIWLGVNVFLFVWYYLIFDQGNDYIYTKAMLGPALPLARGSAACLNFNCMLILLPVCRNTVSFVRGWCTCCPRRIRRVLDKNITFHKLCAYMIVFMTLIHYYSHSFNVHYYSTAHDPLGGTKSKNNTKLVLKLASLGDQPNETYLDPIRKSTYPVASVFLLTGGWTGVIITTALLLMVTSSTEFVRRSYFEVFWFTHHLFLVFFGFLMFHAIGGQVRGQTNTVQHDPRVCSQIDPDEWAGNVTCSTKPQFAAGPPASWKWCVGPLTLYLIERIVRFVRSMQHVEVLKVVKHPSRVVELQMRKRGFKAEVGQYIFVHCPDISFLEWHPFTLTSSPEETYFSVHIRIAGDWTSALSKSVGADEPGGIQPSWKMPRIAVDGPFGTASEDIFEYDVAICVGSGIGVTPFASLLKSVYYKTTNDQDSVRLSKVYFFWICPDTHAFEWFGDMLKHLENQLIQSGKQDLIDYNIYLTRGWTPEQAKTIAVHEEDDFDVITGLDQKTNYGRPNWNDIFAKVATSHPDTQVGVFFCGVAALSKTLHQMCNKHSSSSVTFSYNKENF